MTKKKTKLKTDEIAVAQRQADKIRKELGDSPDFSKLVTRKDRQDAAPFYFVLREYIAKLKIAREKANMTLEDVSEKTNLAIETLSRLENGALTNPTWKTLGTYAAAIGGKPLLDLETIAEAKAESMPFNRISRFEANNESGEAEGSEAFLESIQISESAWADPPNGFGFPAKRVFDVIEHKTNLSKLKWIDLNAAIYAKLSPSGFVDVVCMEEVNQKNLVSLAIRVFPDLCDKNLGELTPLEIVEEFTERFGLPMYVGSLRGKFILEKEVPIPRLIVPGTPPNQFINIENPENVSCVCGFMLNVIPPKLRIAMACCINTDAYTDWAKSHVIY